MNRGAIDHAAGCMGCPRFRLYLERTGSKIRYAQDRRKMNSGIVRNLSRGVSSELSYTQVAGVTAEKDWGVSALL